MTSTSPRFIKKPHAAIICGATDCGKTEFTLNLLETEYKQFLNTSLLFVLLGAITKLIYDVGGCLMILIMYFSLILKSFALSQKIP